MQELEHMTKSEAKFTAGPWQRTDYSDEDGVLFEMELAGANGAAICRIDFEGVDNTAYAEADARLIAAAPELLHALQMARSYIIASGAKHWEKDLAKVDAAIAKAEGL